MILIADPHVGAEGDADEFFEMLDMLSSSEEPIVFLGDVFDLWIGVDRYETEIHSRYLKWANAQLPKRSVGLIEGNHEFYIGEHHGDCFSWISDTEYRDGDLLFAHGDLVNKDDISYVRFRRIIRNSFTKWVARLLPFGPSLSHFVKRTSKGVNKAYRGVLPNEALEAYAGALAERGVTQAFLGHFHRDYQAISRDACTLHMVPGWFVRGEVARFEPDSGRLEIVCWRDLLNTP